MMKQTYMQSMQALGTSIELRLVVSSVIEAEIWFTQLWKEVVTFENTFSRFKFESELTQFNIRAGEKVPVSKMCKDIFERAKECAEITDGMYNPFILPSLQRAGYIDSMTTCGDTTEKINLDFSERDVVVYTELEIGENWARIPAHSALDLGGIGKGYLADYLASLLATSVDNYCLSLGGDIVAKGTDEFGEKWSIDIQSSKDRSTNCAHFASEENSVGVATSGTVRVKRGKMQEHQINPVSQTPTKTPYSLCSVASRDATTADVMASTILVGGVVLAKRLLKEDIIMGVLLQDEKSEKPLVLGKGFTLI